MAENNLERECRLLLAMERAVLSQTTSVASTDSTTSDLRGYTCCVPNCVRQGYSGGYCNAHYLRNRSSRDMEAPLRARKRDDNCTECGDKTGAKGGWGLCPKHYKKRRYTLLKSALVKEMGGQCEKCEKSYPLSVYDFHHIGNKSDSPSTIIGSKSLASVAKELSVCILLCANCHREEHGNDY